MTLSAGTRLGAYEIVAPVGAGGQGEVYEARDTRLDRTVAIKVLPSHLANDVKLRARFEREARAVSALNHPHISTGFPHPNYAVSPDGQRFVMVQEDAPPPLRNPSRLGDHARRIALRADAR